MRNLRLALLCTCATFAVAGAAAAQAVVSSPAPQENTQLDDIVVTGSLIRQSGQPSPTDVVDLDQVDQRGISNASELVKLLPANSGSEAQVDGLNQPLTSGTAQFNLRNLGLGSTLVLLNGRRQTLSAAAANDGSTFVDINSLAPLIAMRRIEVVKDGGAATYGSDAVAGVVNFITRTSVDRPEMSAKYLTMDGSNEVDIQGIIGREIFGGDLVLAASYFSRSTLGTDERSFSRASTFGRPSWHSVSSYGQPGSYFRPSTNGFAPDPNCTNAAFPFSYRNSAADAFCRLDFSEFFDLMPKENREQVFGTWNGDIAPGVRLNLEASYSHALAEGRASPSFPILAVSPVVPRTHPDNPFGEDVRFRGRLLGPGYGASVAEYEYDTYRLAGGLEGALSSGWTWAINAAYSRQDHRYDKPDTLATNLQNALRGLGGTGCNPATGVPGVGPCVYFNPFASAQLGTGTRNSDALVQSLIGYTGLDAKADLFTIDAVTSGEIMDWAGGTIAGAVGVQYRRSTFAHDWSPLVNAGELITLGQAPDFSGTQETSSVFGELQVPFGDALQLQASVRYENYADGFDNVSPKVALLYRPFDQLSLRASWGKAFRAPSTYQQVAVQATQPSVNDNGIFNFVNTQTFGSRDLEPEESSNYNFGATVRPFPGLELGVDFYGFKYDNLIVKENPQAIVNQARADTLAGRTGTVSQLALTRDVTGALVRVRTNFINASSVETDGVDVTARYSWDTSWGGFAANAAWTRVNSYDIQFTPGAAAINGAGSVNFNNLGRSLPVDRVEGGLTWNTGPHQLVALAHYVSSYTNDRTGITNANIDSQTTFDLQYNVTLDGLFGSVPTKLSVGVINVADEDPPIVQLNLGFDPIVHDPRGRVLYLSINQSF
jgi:iron complex outermembrane receptor protein